MLLVCMIVNIISFQWKSETCHIMVHLVLPWNFKVGKLFLFNKSMVSMSITLSRTSLHATTISVDINAQNFIYLFYMTIKLFYVH